MFRACCTSQLTTDNELLCALSPVSLPSREVVACCPGGGHSPELASYADYPRMNASGDFALLSAVPGAPTKVISPDAFLLKEDRPPPLEFTVIMERQGKQKWGIDIEWRNRTNLKIVNVKEGLIRRWNAENPSLRVDAGDLILQINGIANDAERLVREISASTTLVMRVQKVQDLALMPSQSTILPVVKEDEVLRASIASLSVTDYEALPVVKQEEEGVARSSLTWTYSSDWTSSCSLTEGGFERLDIFADRKVYNLNLFEHGMIVDSLRRYFTFCRDFVGLLITTSCFSVWSEAGETNGAAKVVPAVPSGSEPVQIFVFDDKMNLHLGGAEQTKGSCNLRDIQTGKFIDFSDSENGFVCDRLFRHTLVHHSCDYNNVLVQVNIMDAMTNPEYFTGIIKKYAKPSERLVVYLDVYGTVIWEQIIEDTTCYDVGLSEILLCSMFRYVEVRPPGSDPVSFSWESHPKVTLMQSESLLNLVKRVLNLDHAAYETFWSFRMCKLFFNAVTSVAKVGWQEQQATITTNEFFMEYTHYIECMRRSSMGAGINANWLKCYDKLVEGGHSVVVNSFNTKAQKILQHLVLDPKSVPQFLVNFSLWRQDEVELMRLCLGK